MTWPKTTIKLDYTIMKSSNSNQKIKEIIQRIDLLEQANEVTQTNFAIFREIAGIITEVKELPVGKLVMNRAINRHKLHYLKHVVLPRRQRQLIEFHSMKIPAIIKKDFVNDEMELIKQATRSILHREHYEKIAAEKVQSFFSLLFTPSPKRKKLSYADSQ